MLTTTQFTGEPLYLREALAAHDIEANHVKICQTERGWARCKTSLVVT